MELTISKKEKNKAQRNRIHKEKNGGHLKWCIISLFYYNKFWLEAQHPAGLLSISCLSYNKGSNWLTTLFLGFYVRQ